MSARLTDEQMIPLRDAARHIPGRPHISTIYRWVATGVRGVRLETVAVGHARYTSREAIDRFIARCSADRDDVVAVGESRAADAAEIEADQLGL